MTLDSDGKLGINTSSPTYMLDVDGNASINGSTFIVDAANSRVGIGTTSPANILDVEGNMAIGSAYSGGVSAPTDGLIIQGSLGLAASTPDRKVEIFDQTGPQLRLTYGDATIYTDLQTTSSGYLYLNPSGNRVGIDTSTPTEALSVEGNVSISKNIFVNGLLWVNKIIESSTHPIRAYHEVGGRVQTSDGDLWKKAGTLPSSQTILQSTAALAYDGRMWLFGGINSSGSTNTTYYSTDGSTWTYVGTLPEARSGHQAVIFNGKMWILGGAIPGITNTTYYSTDGSTWTAGGELPISVRNQGAIVHDGKMWIIGGDTGASRTTATYYSTDGSTWTVGGTLGTALGGNTVLVFNDTMWSLGGWDGGSTYYNNTYYSTDGSTWTAGGDLPGKIGFASGAVYDGRMWLIAGNNNTGTAINRTYYSTDGSTWTEATDELPKKFHDHETVVYDGRMWVLGGTGVTGDTYRTILHLNDVNVDLSDGDTAATTYLQLDYEADGSPDLNECGGTSDYGKTYIDTGTGGDGARLYICTDDGWKYVTVNT
jgi:N-acetylneuraminic acid mutarotase